MKIGIISDTHDHHENVLKAVEIFNRHKVEYVLHAGDICSPFTANAFSAVKDALFIAVLGNNDGEKFMLRSTIDSFGGQLHSKNYSGIIGGKKIFMVHKPDVLEDIILKDRYDIVIYGHTHIRDMHNVGKTLVMNPGEATDWISGRGGVVILETEDLKVETIEF